MERLAILALVLTSCIGDSDPLSDRVYSAVADAWTDSGLRAPLASCRLAWFRIEAPATLEQYRASCPAASWACLRWRLEKGRARSLRYPAAVVSPTLPNERVAAVAIHELLHAHGFCASLWRDWYDYDHADARVWESGGPDSAESVAERRVYGLEAP